MADKAGDWFREFDDPILLPDGTELSTLRQAVAYLARTVPAAERDMPRVMAAAEMLTNAAERGMPGCFWRVSQHFGPSIGTVFEPSTPIAKRRIGTSGS
jgi:hypothetical protein